MTIQFTHFLLGFIQVLRCLIHSLRAVRYSRFKARIRPQVAIIRKRNKPRWVVREIIRLKALTNLSTRKLADTFNRRYAASKHITISKSTVATIIKTHQAEILQLRQRWKRHIPAPLARNHIWGMDITGKMDTQGHIHPILGIIDHGSRLALTLRPLTDKTSLTLLKALIISIETVGMPRILRTDNEAVFVCCKCDSEAVLSAEAIVTSRAVLKLTSWVATTLAPVAVRSRPARILILSALNVLPTAVSLWLWSMFSLLLLERNPDFLLYTSR